MNRETKFPHLKTPAMLGERNKGWRVCWLGDWDRGRLFYLVMVEEHSRAVANERRLEISVLIGNGEGQPILFRVAGRALNEC